MRIFYSPGGGDDTVTPASGTAKPVAVSSPAEPSETPKTDTPYHTPVSDEVKYNPASITNPTGYFGEDHDDYIPGSTINPSPRTFPTSEPNGALIQHNFPND